MGLVDKIRERKLKAQQKREIERQKELERLSSLSEKELLIEVILKLNEISEKCDDLEHTAKVYSD